MGYLSNQNNEIIVDAILTKYGREKLAAGQQLGIIKFALSDDEIDYTLYNVNHPMGSDFFDLAIRSLPILEPVPNSTRQFRYYLYTSSTQTSFQYTLQVGIPSQFTIGLNQVGSTYGISNNITPTPSNISQVWYSLKIPKTNASYLKIEGVVGSNISIPDDLAQIIQRIGGTTEVFQDSVIAYGFSFRATVLALPPTRTIVTGVVDSHGVATAPSNIQVILDRNANISTPS